MNDKIILISGPSGSGKSTLINKLMSEFENIYFSISSTTRAIRNGEKNGINYHFISIDDFKQGIEKNEFLEWALVHGSYYGTSLKPVLNALNEGKIVIFDIDVQGFDIAKQKFNDKIISIFVTTKNENELKTRLLKRGTNSKDDIDFRLKNAKDEMKRIKDYDYLIINDDLETAYNTLKSIFKSIQNKIKFINLENFIKNWS